MDKDQVLLPQQSSKAMDDDEVQEDQQQEVVDDDPYGFLVEQCIIPSAEENHLRSMPLFSPPTPTPTPIPTQQQPSPPPVVKHEQTPDEIDTIMKEKEATENMKESQSVTKEPTISVENSPPIDNEGFSQQSPPTRDEPAAADDDETPSPVTGVELQKTIEEESLQFVSLGKSPLEQNEGCVQPQSPPTKTQTEQTHFVRPRFQTAAAAAAAAVGVGVGPSSSSSPSNPRNPKEGDDDTTIDILDVLRSKGFYVPRPRWWRPEGYDKH